MVLYRQSSRPDHDCIYYFIYDELKKQIWYSIQVSVTLLFCTTTCWQAHWTSWSLLQVMFRLRGPFPTVTQPEATLGDRIDLRISGQPEEPYPLNERQAKVFFIFSLMKQVLKFPNKSTESNDLIKNHSQKSAEKVDYIPVQCRDSENASQNCNLARLGVFKVEDRVQIHTRDTLYKWKHATRHHRGGQEAGRATNHQSIHHVHPWNAQNSTEEYSKGLTLWKLCRFTNTRKQEIILVPPKKKNGTVVERYFEDEQYQMRMHEQ